MTLNFSLRHFFAVLGLFTVSAWAAEEATVAAVRAADDERVEATRAGDRARLAAIYSDDLRYVHSNGKVDDKAEHVDGLAKRTSVYENFDYQTREFRLAATGVMLMSGRVVIHSTNAKGKNQNDVNFLAVWRLEQGQWKFLAWQAAKNLPPVPAKP